MCIKNVLYDNDNGGSGNGDGGGMFPFLASLTSMNNLLTIKLTASDSKACTYMNS